MSESKYLLFLVVLVSARNAVSGAPVNIAPVVTESSGREPLPQCDPGEDSCSQCYDLLVNEMIISNKNRFNLQKVFFPANNSNPVFVRVTYHFTRNPDGPTDYLEEGSTQEWFWTQSTFYLFQPIASLQFTSLLFSDTTLSSNQIDLYLQPSCENSSIDMMQLLTQRLKSYTAMQTIAAPISDDYDAKGESLETLLKFHNGSYIDGGQHLSYYTFAFHFVFPFLGVLFVANLLHHFVENNKLIFVRSDKSADNDSHGLGELKISTVNMTVYISVTCCFLFVLFVIVLDCIGVNKRVFFVQDEIYYFPEAKSGNESSVMTLILEFSVPGLMLAEDLLVLVLMFLMCIRKLCTRTKSTDKQCCKGCSCLGQSCKLSLGSNKKWYNIIMGPISCLLIHSYHILVGFIHTPHHATSMLVFYGLMIVTFILTLKAAYYNLFKLYQWHQRQSTCNCICRILFCLWPCVIDEDEGQGTIVENDSEGTITREWNEERERQSRCNKICRAIVCCCPIMKEEESTQTGESNQVDKGKCCYCPFVIKKKEDEEANCIKRSKTKCARCCYSSFLIFCFYWFCRTKNNQHCCALLLIFGLSILTGLVFVYIAFLFILVPINHVIDDAPARILSINQTIVILFGAAITYKIYQDRKFETFLDYLVRAVTNKDKIEDRHFKDIKTDAWEKMSRNERRKEVAYVALSAMYETAKVIPNNAG